MQVTITTGERKTGIFGGSTEIYIKCEIVLTPEEKAILPQSGNPITRLADAYGDYDSDVELSRHSLLFNQAIHPGGADMVVHNHGQLQEKENECIERCRQVQTVLNNLKGYKVEKSYVIDLEKEDEGEKA